MNAQHTPGPWTNDDDGFIYAADATKVADPHCVTSADIDEREANAALIAAAPDLLEALKDAYYALYGDGPGNPKMRAAIDKAEGRT